MPSRMGCFPSATTARRREENFRDGRGSVEARGQADPEGIKLGTQIMSLNQPTSFQPTWTTERVELLKLRFAEGLSCREIAADIGVSRNAVIGKISRLNLTRDKGRTQTLRQKDTAPRPKASVRLRQLLIKIVPAEPEPEPFIEAEP